MRKLGICSDFTDESVNFSTLDKIKEAGFDSVFVRDYGDVERRIEYALKIGLEVETIHSPFDGINAIWEIGDEGERMLARLKRTVEICKRYGIPISVVHVSSGDNPPRVSDVGLKRFDELISYAKKSNVILAFENLRKIGHLDSVLSAYKDDSTVGFCYDCGHENCFTKGISYPELYGEKLVCVHLHDNSCKKNEDLHLLPFDGSIDFKKVAAKLREVKYRGTVMIETHKGNPFHENTTIEEYIKTAYERADRIRNLLDE